MTGWRWRAQQGLALNPSVNFIDFYDNAANSNYNAMVATLTHNFANSFQAEAQYTWGKAMDELSGPYFEDPYPYNVHAAYGRSSLQRAERGEALRAVAAGVLPREFMGGEDPGRMVAERDLELAYGLPVGSGVQHGGKSVLREQPV